MMLKVFCPKSGKLEWANPSGKDDKKNPTCTKCGEPHAPARQQ